MIYTVKMANMKRAMVLLQHIATNILSVNFKVISPCVIFAVKFCESINCCS